MSQSKNKSKELYLFDHVSGNEIAVGSARIYIEECGFKDRIPVIFLHGGFGTIEDFNLLLPKLQGHFRCIGIDSRGHGRSTLGKETLNFDRLASDVTAILKDLGITKCCLVGHSDGGIIAYRLAIREPALVSKIFALGADWNYPSSELRVRFSLLTAEKWQERFPDTVTLYSQLNSEADFSRLLKSVVGMWTDTSDSGYPNHHTREIQCEALILRGNEDHLVPSSCITDLNESFINAKGFNIPFCGHSPHVEQSEIVSRILDQFLASDSVKI